MSWTDTSAKWIAEMAKAHPGLDKPALEKACRAAYPFAERRGWAYKAWLKAMRAYFHPERVRRFVPFKKTQPSPAELEKQGQGRLL